MNTEQKENIDGETSRNTEESSSLTENINTQTTSAENSFDNHEKNSPISTELHNKLNTQPQLSQTVDQSSIQNSTEKTNIVNLFSKPIDQRINDTQDNSTSSPENNDMKRASAKELIERYFYQVLDGCGKGNCENKCCASSGEIDKLTPNEAAARAIQLFSQEAKLCDVQPSKIPRTSDISGQSSQSILVDSNESNERDLNINKATTSKATESSFQNCSNSNNFKESQSLCADSSSRLPHTSSQHKTNHHNDDLSASSSNATTPSSQSSSASGHSSNSTPTTSVTSNDNLFIHNDDILKNSTLSSYKRNIKKIELFLDENILNELIDECERVKSYSKLIHRIGEVFSSTELLSKSFRKKPQKKKKELKENLTDLKKEDLRVLEGDKDKDEDSSAQYDDNDAAAAGNSIDEYLPYGESDTILDIESFRRSILKLFTIEFPCYEALNNGLHSLSILVGVDLRMVTDKKDIEKIVHVFVMVFELMTMGLSEFLDNALPNICRAASYLPTWAQAKLARIWAKNCKSSLKCLLETLQQLISIQAITNSLNRCVHVEDNEKITNATKILKILYYANILAGNETHCNNITENELEHDSDAINDTVADDDDFYVYSHVKKSHRTKIEDHLQKELGITILNSRTPFIPFDEFYNEPLSDTIEMNNDYLYYKNYTLDTRIGQHDKKFTFMLYSFILTPATKVIALYYDSRMRMYSERTMSLFNQSTYYGGENNGAGPNPYLKLKVRREKLIDDALVELEMIAMGTPKDFKKQLVVEFIGEQGIDEGGVSKEFFQLVVEEIFNPDFGMFTYQEDSKTVWFNPTSFENEAQFTLIGIVLGLAIYNNIILAVNFPMVVYRKLMGGRGTFYDLNDWNPVIFNSLKSMLDYENDDMEDVFMQTFKISYTDVFGNKLDYELKENGDDIMVNQDNKMEFVELYSDYLLNGSVEKQFKAFKKGFEMVTDESPLKLLFRPEEIELLVCGSRKFDFVELEKSTEYEGGFTNTSQIIIDFWNIVHCLPMESKRKLLEFTTGSDRVPVGGLSRLKLVIARNGPDSDRLPTSHTCFNVLLLPEYDSKDKLEDRLLKAINYSKGFGML